MRTETDHVMHKAPRQAHEARPARKAGVWAAVMILLIHTVSAPALALPQGGAVRYGEAAIGASGSALAIAQGSERLIVEWDAFDIGAAESVTFIQSSASSVALNRVVGRDPSAIDGRLKANGQVFLLNPNGILFGPGSQVNVGGLLASTLAMNDSDFLASRYRLEGSSAASVVHEGAIAAAPGGYVALVGREVVSDGAIDAPGGDAALAAGGAVRLAIGAGGALGVEVEVSALGAQVRQGGVIAADGGSVLLTARATDALLDTVINQEGIIRARTVEDEGGVIRLLGGMEGGTVRVGGTLDASAPEGGDGGFIETSGAHVRVEDGAHVTTAASAGATGMWLIDPTDLVIGPGGFMSGSALGNSLELNSVMLATLADGAGEGNITIDESVTWSSDNSLTLRAHNRISVNADIIASGAADITLRADADADGAGTVEFPGGTVSTGGTVKILYNPASYTDTATKSDTGGNPYTSFVTAGNGLTAYMLVNDVDDLQAMSANLAGLYALGRDIDASVTKTWNGGAGFEPVGTSATPFTGRFDGQGHVIDGLFINRPGESAVGLFGFVGSDGILQNVGLAGADVTGGDDVGILAGTSSGSIRSAFSVGTVSGEENVGGLVGINRGTITDAYSFGAVSGTTAGGLVGRNGGEITRAYSTGTVSGDVNEGGLVGLNSDLVPGEVHASFWDTDTSLTDGVGSNPPSATFDASGESTATLMTQATFTAEGWDFGNTWGIVEGISYPYFRWRFPDGPIVVSGFVNGVAGGNDRLGVAIAADGAVAGVTHTGDNGFYYATLDPFDEEGALLAWLDGTRFGGVAIAERGNAVSDLLLNGHAAGMDIAAGTLSVRTGQSSFGETITHVLDRAKGSLAGGGLHLYEVNAGTLALDPGSSLTVTATGSSFTVDQAQALEGQGALRIETTAGDLTVDQALSTEEGAVTLISAGDVTLKAGAIVTSGAGSDAIVVAAAADFINQAGSAALNATAGRWLVYAVDPSTSVFDGLDSGNTAIWNATYATRPPASVAAGGNRYLFAYQPTLVFTSTDLGKTYGDIVNQATLDGAYRVDGLHEGIDGVFAADTLGSALSGTPLVTSEGAAGDASVGDGPYEITISQGGLTSPAGYALSFVSAGKLNVTPKAITLDGVTVTEKVYDGTRHATLNTGAAVLVGTVGDDVVTLDASRYVAAFDTPGVGDGKPVTVVGLALSGPDAGNYTLVQPVGLTGNIARATLVVRPLPAFRLVGEPNPEFDVEYSGFVAGEGASVLAGKVVFTSEATPASPPGTYPVVVDPAGSTLSAANYDIVYEPGVLTVTAPERELPTPEPDCFAGAAAISAGAELRWVSSGVYCGARTASSDLDLFTLEEE